MEDIQSSASRWSLVAGNLCLYAGFMIFESVADHGTPASHRAVLEVGEIWVALFITAVLAARCSRQHNGAGLVKAAGRQVIQSLVWPLVIEYLPEPVELSLL